MQRGGNQPHSGSPGWIARCRLAGQMAGEWGHTATTVGRDAKMLGRVACELWDLGYAIGQISDALMITREKALSFTQEHRTKQKEARR